MTCSFAGSVFQPAFNAVTGVRPNRHRAAIATELDGGHHAVPVQCLVYVSFGLRRLQDFFENFFLQEF
jgi:hypothetical protein